MFRWLSLLAVALGLTFAAAPADAAPRTIAIAYFDNNSGSAELEPLRKGLADMLITDLGAIGALQIVERARLNQVLDELKLSRTKLIDPKTAQKLGKGLAAQLIMTGGYIVQGDTMRIDVRVVEVQTGAVAASDKVEGQKDDFFALEKDLVDLLVKTLDVKLSPGERSKLRVNSTQSFAAWQRYSAGLDASDRGDAGEARRQFQAALDADPSYRAAKSATERLRVIFDKQDAAHAQAIEAQWKALDPKAPTFARDVDNLLSSLIDTEADQLKQKVALLTFLVDHNLSPAQIPQVSGTSMNLMMLIQRFYDSPDSPTVIPPACEYVINRYPQDRSVAQQCKLLLKLLERIKPTDYDRRKQAWDTRWATTTLEWELALKAAMPDIERLLRLCGQKARKP
jgi:TolB-like protein